MNLTKEKLLEIFKEKKVVLAPMAGITSFSYRKLMQKFGVALSYTEMISDCGLIYGNDETFELLNTDGNEGLLALQIFGGDKDNLVKAIKIIEESNIKYDILDLNLACPVYKVVRNNGGSSWLKDLTKLEEMLKAVVSNSKKPVSCKIRLGWDESHINVKEVVKIIENCGVILVAIHARTAKQGYSGVADYEKLKYIKDEISIPLIISGDIFKIEDAIKALEITKADAVMVARGGIGNPKLIEEINYYFKNNEVLHSFRDFNTQKELLVEFSKALIEEKGEKRAISMLRGIAPKFFSSFPFSKELRTRISTSIKSYNDLENILKEFENIQNSKKM